MLQALFEVLRKSIGTQQTITYRSCASLTHMQSTPVFRIGLHSPSSDSFLIYRLSLCLGCHMLHKIVDLLYMIAGNHLINSAYAVCS